MKNFFLGACLTFALLWSSNGDRTNADGPVKEFRPAPAAMLHASLKIRAYVSIGKNTRAIAYGSGFPVSAHTFVTAFHVVATRDNDSRWVTGEPGSGNDDPRPLPKPRPKTQPIPPKGMTTTELPYSDQIEIQVKYDQFKGSAWIPAHVVKFDSTHDVAVLQIDGTVFPYTISVGDEGLLQPGDPTWVVGAPGATSPQIATLGYFASTEPEDGTFPYLFISSNGCFFGNSGGMVVDANRGGVVGVLVQTRGSFGGGSAPNISIWVPMSFVRPLLVGLTP